MAKLIPAIAGAIALATLAKIAAVAVMITIAAVVPVPQ